MAWAPETVPGSGTAGPSADLGDRVGGVPGPRRREVTAPELARAAADAPTLEVLRLLGSGPRGLTEAQADARLVRYGENTVAGRRPPGPLRRFARSARDPFTAVLLGLGLVSAAVTAWTTACVIVVLVVVSCVLRVTGEHRAERATAALRELVAGTATVRRREHPGGPARADPAPREVPVEQLVPGDVIRLGPGDLVPADLRLLRASGLTVYQSALTGASAPVAKHPVDVPRGGPGADEPFERPHLCFQGGSVAAGSGTAVVYATGADTRFAGTRVPRAGGTRVGVTRARVPRVGVTRTRLAPPRRETAFDRSVHGISWTLIRFMLVTPALVLLVDAVVRGRGLATLPFAVAVAVGLTPEMLPVIVTTTLARGSRLLAREHEVIVKRLPALHDLGAMDVLCTDKTGTLTRDRPMVDCHVDPAGRVDPDVLHWAALNSWWTLQLADPPVPDALDEAVLTGYEEAGAREAEAAERGPDAPWTGLVALPDHPTVPDHPADHDGLAASPFDPVRRTSCAVVRRPGRPGPLIVVVKGAVDDVLDRCARVRLDGRDRPLDAAGRAAAERSAADLAADGLRLLAVALAERPADTDPEAALDASALTLIGFVGLRDALADTAADALAVLADRGVAVKVLTGDLPGTAARVCRDLGLHPGEVVTAERIDALDDAELGRLAAAHTVFARCTPAHKARIVGALRAAGHTTGFLGDGVNDLPALHACDVGICPRDAVDVTREAADVVLVSKDLGAIDEAIVAGRRGTGTIAGYLRITLSCNLGNVIAMLMAGLLLPFLPMLPAQVLVQNLCFDAAQAAFVFDRPAAATLRRPGALHPRDLLRFIAGFGLLNAVADLATFTVLVLMVRHGGEVDQEAFHAGWFTENLLTQALVILLLCTGRGVAVRRASRPILIASAGLAVIGVLLPLTPVAPALGMASLPIGYYPVLAGVLALYAGALTPVRRCYDRRRAERG
ncbi:magnesium-translocating P-type ATPase [Embleya scabrispora]|uniref:Magnesium-transporting ATPase, P-type 1 n=1 Tax=Embleya scabrispora TaxID=159449 RepID=A0A1T3NR30_9ACTN|nr:HAD-IC family P-type ATPase [Embleya scabrispora]OPC79170.1 magnesium-translocating P-type ATPase [Embleya scabrispora]